MIINLKKKEEEPTPLCTKICHVYMYANVPWFIIHIHIVFVCVRVCVYVIGVSFVALIEEGVLPILNWHACTPEDQVNLHFAKHDTAHCTFGYVSDTTRGLLLEV